MESMKKMYKDAKQSLGDAKAEATHTYTAVHVGGEEFMFAACICAYASLHSKDHLMGLKADVEFLCCDLQLCAATNHPPYEAVVGENMKGHRYHVGTPCCQVGIKQPEVFLAAKKKLFCLNIVASLPFDPKFVNSPVCGVCFLRLLPGPVGCMLPPPAPSIGMMMR
jgi:hypothetical protein